VRMLPPDGIHDSALMAAALRGLSQQPLPSERGAAKMLNGLKVIGGLVAEHVSEPVRTQARVARN